jgi:topoisomerase-4 subunit A
VEDIDFREGDFNKFIFESNTKHIVMFFTDKGNMYQLKGAAIPEFRWKEKGERLDEIIRGLNLNSEKIISVYSLENTSILKDFIFITSKGNIKKTGLDKFISSYTKLVALKMRDEESLIKVSLVDKERELSFIKMITKQRLEFTVEEPEVDALDRNIASTLLAALPFRDEIIEAQFVDCGEYKEFYLALNEDGSLRQIASRRSITKKEKCVFTDTTEKLLVFLDNGSVLNVSACIFSNLKDEGINLIDLFYQEKSLKVLNILAVKDFSEQSEILFVTKNGLVKKTKLEEFKGEYSASTAYKFKTEEDKLIAVEYSLESESKDILVVTKKALGIRFKSSDVPAMGKIASGVIAMSLKEEDEVVYAALISQYNQSAINNVDEIALAASDEKTLVLITNKKNKVTMNLEQIKQQNRAGKGVTLTVLIFDEQVKEVKII